MTERTVGTVLPAVKENMGKLKVLFASMVLRIWAHDAAYCLSLLFARQAVLLAFWRLRRLLVELIVELQYSWEKTLVGENAEWKKPWLECRAVWVRLRLVRLHLDCLLREWCTSVLGLNGR